MLAPGRPGRAIQLIDARDLAEWVVRGIEAGATGVFNATGPDSMLTMERLLDECRIVTGSVARPVWVGERFLLEAGVEPWGELPLWVPEESGPEFRGFMSVNCSKAYAAGLTFRKRSRSEDNSGSLRDIGSPRQLRKFTRLATPGHSGFPAFRFRTRVRFPPPPLTTNLGGASGRPRPPPPRVARSDRGL